jgi:hypothetical protein
MKKRVWITISIMLAIFLLAYIILNRPLSGTSEKVAKCIGENAVLYVQLGCHACEKQEKMFGENYQSLNIVDCWFESEKCFNITTTPTWIINRQEYLGVQEIEDLRQFTGC